MDMEMNAKKCRIVFQQSYRGQKKSRILLLAALVLLVAVLGSIHVSASGTLTASASDELETMTAGNLLADSDELFEGYVEQLFELDDADSSSAGSSVLQSSAIQKSAAQTSGAQATTRQVYVDRIISGDAGLLGNAGGTHLTDINLEIYTQLKAGLQKIASGEESSSVVSAELSFTYAELGVEDFASAREVFANSYNATYIFEYLLLDCPYELYWFDKTTGVKPVTYYSSQNATMEVTVTWSFAVAEDYQGNAEYTVDASKVETAEAAAANAKKIVSAYAGKTDREKLTAYKDEICEMVDYEDSYASDSYGDIWELIYVFDDDDSTNVVCEGYAKAFQYLCDLSSFDNAACYTVEGNMSGGTGAGGHMWNLVCLNGVNYMVDVTNSDEDTIGEDGGLFLVCADDATSSSASGYSFTISKTTISYTYSATILVLYEESIRTLGTKTSISSYSVTLGTKSYTYDGTAKTPTVTVKSTDGKTTLTSGTDYTVAYSNNTNAGTATVTVTGTGDYTGTLTATFTISAASISSYKVSLGTTSYTYDGSAKKPTVTVKNSAGTKTLTSGTDYTVAYTNNTNAGTATVKVTGTGNYTGTLSTTFTIKKASQTVTVTAASTTLAPGGSTTTVTATTTADGSITFSSSDTSVAKVGSSTGKVTSADTGTVTITATAAATTNYSAASATVKITVKLGTCSVSYINNTMYGLKVVWGEVTGASGYYVYIRNDDGTYSTAYTDYVEGGSTTEWTDKRDLTGGKDYTYKVAAYYENSDGTITVGSSGTTKTCKYLKWGVVESVTNTSTGPKVTWTKVAGANGYYIFRKSSSDSDYTQVATVTGTSVVSWTDTDSLTSGKNYTYKVSAIFTNSKGQVTKGGALTTKSVKYLTAGTISSISNTSSGVYIKWTKVTGATGYYVYRKSSSASSYTLVKTITSVGTVSYTDTTVKSSNNVTYTYYIQPYFKNSSGAITKAGYTTTAVVRLVAPTISSLTNSSSKTLTLKWGTKSGVTGYEIQYSTSSSFASGNKTVTVTGSSSSSKAISSLTKGKTYYVRIRTYKTVNGTKYYSAWSTAKSVKISK